MRILPLAAAVAALLVPAAPAYAGDPVMPLSDVQAGMHCTGYSVVRGTAISSFDVNVVDVADGFGLPIAPAILVTVSGPAENGMPSALMRSSARSKTSSDTSSA